MAEGPGIIAVDTIAHDDSALERRVAELVQAQHFSDSCDY